MLFLLNDGVPSVAKWVRLGGDAPDVPAVPPDPDDDPGEGPGSGPGTDDPDSPWAGDLTGPRLRLRFPEGRWLKRLRHTGVLRVRVTVDERATVDARLLRRKRRVARRHVQMRAGTRRLELRPRRRAIRWLRHKQNPRLRFKVVAVDGAENDTVWTRVLHR
jgi:hypothetical protein